MHSASSENDHDDQDASPALAIEGRIEWGDDIFALRCPVA